jgi:L-lactate dehydrogenase complex protein LldG
MALIDLLIDRLVDYKAGVVRCADDARSIRDAVNRVRIEHHIVRLVVPAGLPAGWLDPEHRQSDDPALSVDELDASAGVLTGSAVTIAETGTIVLDAGPHCGRRAITLVPDLHVCVVRAEQIVHSVPEGLDRLDPTRPLTFISGPSATSDIELNRVEGVHGPRELVVIIASDSGRESALDDVDR